MRNAINRLVLLTAALLVLAVPVIADEGVMNKDFVQGQQGKDECLLVARNCGNNMDTIYERIERIQGEIRRGTDVYTTDELKNLNRKLQDEMENLRTITTGG